MRPYSGVTEDGPFCVGPDWKPRRNTRIVGTCGACGVEMPIGGRRLWCCSPECTRRYQVNHFWGYARREAIRQAGGRCRMCWPVGHHGVVLASGAVAPLAAPVALEVNHIEPRRGRGYGNGCHHHQANLEPLCRPHHLGVTRLQRGRRVGAVGVDR